MKQTTMRGAALAVAVLASISSKAEAQRPDVVSLRRGVVALQAAVADLRRELGATRSELSSVKAELAALKSNTVLTLDGVVSRTQDSEGHETVRFRGVNVQVTNGTGSTSNANGVGNVVIGYSRGTTVDRRGSHNLVLGGEQAYPNTGELVTPAIASYEDLALVVANDMEMIVGAQQVTSVGANQVVEVGLDKVESVGRNVAASVGADRTLTVGSNLSSTIGATATLSAGQDLNLSVGNDMSVLVDGNGVVDAAQQWIVQSGKASNVFDNNGDIAIEGKNIRLEGAGEVSVRASGDLVLKGSRILQN